MIPDWRDRGFRWDTWNNVKPMRGNRHRSKYTAKRHKRVVGKDRRNRQKQSRQAKCK